MFLACGMTHEQIASALSISGPTFVKAFAFEIQTGRGRARARILAMLNKSARSGNVAAQKKLEEMSRLAEAAAAFAQADAPEAPRGKKEQAAAAAKDISSGPVGDWGNDLNPQSVN